MTAIIPSASDLRRALGPLVDAGDDADLDCVYARAVWSVLTEPGDGAAGALIDAWGPAHALERVAGGAARTADAQTVEAADLTLQDLARGRGRWLPRLADLDRSLELARRAEVQLITPEDADWPVRADDLGPYAPVCLWVRGDPRLVGSRVPAVAIVGARAASAYGEHVASELAAESAVSGISVVSGAAYGIDAAAHSAALGAGGTTIAVMAGGIERAYPAGHRELIDRIALHGAVIAEVPCGTTPTKFRFLSRNRLIAAMSDGTVVVEAAFRSGALNTAHHAAAIGRPLGAVPGPITSVASAGCHRLMREDAAVCITGIEDVRELIGIDSSTMIAELAGYTDERTRLLDALSSRSARSTADVARRAGFDLDEAAALLGLLELDGAVIRSATGWVQARGVGRPR